MSIFVSSDFIETDLRHRVEQGSSAMLLDLPLSPDPDGSSELRTFDAHSPNSDIPAIVPAVPNHALPSRPGDEQVQSWGPRVRRRRVPQAVFEAPSAPDGRRRSHGSGHWLVALLILAALPLGAALGYFLSLAPPVAVLSPELVDFGAVAVGEMAERQATLENRGEQVLRVLEVTLTGGGAADFALLAEACRGAILKPHEGCLLRVAFRPGALGGRRAEILLRSNAVDGIRVLPILGEGR